MIKDFETFMNERQDTSIDYEVTDFSDDFTIDIHTSLNQNDLDKFSIGDFSYGYGKGSKVFKLKNGDYMFQSPDGEDFAIGKAV